MAAKVARVVRVSLMAPPCLSPALTQLVSRHGGRRWIGSRVTKPRIVRVFWAGVNIIGSFDVVIFAQVMETRESDRQEQDIMTASLIIATNGFLYMPTLCSCSVAGVYLFQNHKEPFWRARANLIQCMIPRHGWSPPSLWTARKQT